jgi:hypothetical protein
MSEQKTHAYKLERRFHSDQPVGVAARTIRQAPGGVQLEQHGDFVSGLSHKFDKGTTVYVRL